MGPNFLTRRLRRGGFCLLIAAALLGLTGCPTATPLSVPRPLPPPPFPQKPVEPSHTNES